MEDQNEQYPIVQCQHCGTSERPHWVREVSEKLIAQSRCFTCNFWIEQKDSDIIEHGDRAVITDEWEHFVISDERSTASAMRGFGGRPFLIRFADGREVYTTNLWSQGRIPVRFRTSGSFHLFTPNAEIFDPYGYQWWTDQDELIGFGAILVEAEAVTRRGLIRYLRGPKKYSRLYWEWVRFGRPEPGGDGWTDLWNEPVMEEVHE